MEKVLGEQFLGKNLRYRKDDVRWRHVGNYTSKDGEKHVILYDLADLEEIQPGDANSFVQNTMDSFKARRVIEKETKSPVFVSKETNQENVQSV